MSSREYIPVFQGSVAPRVLGPRKQNHTGTTVYNGVYRMPLGRFSMALISTVRSIVSVPKRMSALETFRRPISEDVSFGVGTLLVFEQSTLENRPRGVCDTYRRRVRYSFDQVTLDGNITPV